MRRKFAAAAIAVSFAALVAACGSDDSSASSTPTFTSSSVTPTTTSGETTADETTTATTAAAPTSPGAAATAPEEQQEAVPSGFPGPTATPIDQRGTKFLATLKQRGVTVAGDGGIAISTANYICSAQSEGVAADQIATFVTANVGAEASAAGTQITPEQAGQMAQTYIDVATSTYCS